jgi:hypothetical protein
VRAKVKVQGARSLRSNARATDLLWCNWCWAGGQVGGRATGTPRRPCWWGIGSETRKGLQHMRLRGVRAKGPISVAASLYSCCVARLLPAACHPTPIYHDGDMRHRPTPSCAAPCGHPSGLRSRSMQREQTVCHRLLVLRMSSPRCAIRGRTPNRGSKTPYVPSCRQPALGLSATELPRTPMKQTRHNKSLLSLPIHV